MDLEEKQVRLRHVTAAIWLVFALWLVISLVGIWRFAGGHPAPADTKEPSSRADTSLPVGSHPTADTSDLKQPWPAARVC